MAEDHDQELAVLRTALQKTLPEPTPEFRRNAWLAFQAALDRHVGRLRRRGEVREVQLR